MPRLKRLAAALLVAACLPARQSQSIAPLPPESAAAVPRGGEQSRTATVATYDLGAGEAEGGHTLARHLGRSDLELRERLQRESSISGASTYPDLLEVVGASLST